MNPRDAVRALERGEQVWETVEPGFGQAFLARVHELSARSPAKAIALANLWCRVTDGPQFVLVARAIERRLQGQWLQAATLFQRAGSEWPHLSIGAVDSLARAGRTAAAVRFGKSLRARLLANGDTTQAARVALNIGNAYVWADNYRAAKRAYRDSLDDLPETFPVDRAAATVGLATASLYSGDLRDALRLGEAARKTFDELGLTAHTWQAELTLAHAATLSGAPDEAILRLRRLASQKLDRETRARVGELRGDACRAANLYEEAAIAYTEAARAYQNPLGRANALLGLAMVQRALGLEASKTCSRAVRAYRQAGNPVWAAFTRVEQASKPTAIRDALRSLPAGRLRAEAQLKLAELTGELGLPLRALPKSLRWRWHALAARLAANPGPSYRKMLREILRERSQTRSRASNLAFLRDKEDALRAYFDFVIRTQQLAELRRAVTQTRAAGLLDEAASLRLGLDPDQLRLVEREAPATGERRTRTRAATNWELLIKSVIETSDVSSGRSAAILLETRDQVLCLEPGLPQLALDILKSDLRALRFDLGFPQLPTASGPSPELRGFASSLPAVVCPDRLTWQVPWCLYRAEETALALAPTASEIAGPISPNIRVLVIQGDCEGLPEARAEVEDLRTRFGDVIVIQDRAALLRLEGHFNVVHVVGHAMVHPENAMFSELWFEDGPMAGVELAQLRLSAGAAVLGACETGHVRPDLPGEASGLVRAFLALGARSVVGNLWIADDEASRRFAGHLYDEWTQSDIVQSVAMARKQVRDWSEHPYFWANPVVFCGVGRNS